jgi:hypothetical protein
MFLLDWLNKKLEYKSQARLHVEGSGDFPQEVVGESHYQRHLKMLNKVWTQEGKQNSLIAELHCENDNEHDKKAVKVMIKGLVVGYLSKEDARIYRKRMKKAELGEIVISCNAKIFGGTDSKLMLGVWLDLPVDAL